MPTSICFGTLGVYQQQRFVGPISISRAIRRHFRHKILKLQITHEKVYVHIAATTPPISLLCYTVAAIFSSRAVHINICINMWSTGILSGWSVQCILCQRIQYTIYPAMGYTACLSWTNIDTDVGASSPGRKNDCDCVTENADHCVVVVVLQQCVHILVDVYAPEILVGPTNVCCW
jgi:hypothetical protein